MAGRFSHPKWTAEQDALVVECLANGMSRAQAGAAVNAKFGTKYTRNAVIGRCDRMRFKSTLKPGRNSGQVRHAPSRQCIEAGAQARRKPAQAPIHQRVFTMPQFNRDGLTGLRCAEVEPLNLTLLETTERDVCRWPVNDGRPKFLFCGHPRLDGSSYCLDHKFLSVGPGTATEKAAHRVSGLV